VGGGGWACGRVGVWAVGVWAVRAVGGRPAGSAMVGVQSVCAFSVWVVSVGVQCPVGFWRPQQRQLFARLHPPPLRLRSSLDF
jgi:hypothetical protein